MPPFYFCKLTCWTLRLSPGWNLVVLGLAAVLLAWYPLAEETRQLGVLGVLSPCAWIGSSGPSS